MKTLMAVMVVTGIFLFSSISYGKETLVVATWGGAWGESLRKNVAEPFEKQFNCNVVFSVGVSGDQVAKVRAQRRNPQLDVVMVTSDFAAMMADEGLTLPIDYTKVPNVKDLYPAAIGKHNAFVSMYGYVVGLGWRTDKLPDLNMEKWEDLWKHDLKKRFGIPYATWAGMKFLLITAKVFGGSEFNIDPGFEKLKQLKPQFARMFKGDAEQHHLFATGEIWVCPFVSPEAMKLMEKGIPMKFIRPKDGVPAGLDTLNVVRGAPNTELAYKFVNFALNEQSQKGHAEGLYTIPLRRGVVLDPKFAKVLPTVEELEKLVKFDDAHVNANKDKWVERYNKEILSF
jgi:putative spermidine/putrescine transport system substrate-binding protein